MLPLALVYFSEYLINQGILPVVRFENAPIDAKDDYRYYCPCARRASLVTFWMDRCSLSSGRFRESELCQYTPYQASMDSISTTGLECGRRPIAPRACVQFANLIFFVFQALYMVVPWIWVLFVLIFWEGLLGGATYVNAFSQMSIHVCAGFPLCSAPVLAWIFAGRSSLQGICPWSRQRGVLNRHNRISNTGHVP